MNYPLKSKPKREYRSTVIVVAIVFSLLALCAFIAPNVTRTVGYGIAKPVWIARDFMQLHTHSFFEYFSFKQNLIKENTDLKAKNNELQLIQTDYDVVKNENSELKNLLGRKTNDTQVLARVLSKPPQSPYDTFVIDVGTDESVHVGDFVFLAGDVSIGKVTSSTSHTSLVTLFSSGNQKENFVLERTGAMYEVSGNGAGNFVLPVPKDSDVLWGDMFVYPGLTSGVVGSVYYIDTSSQSAFKNVYIRFPGNVFEAKWVFVAKTL